MDSPLTSAEGLELRPPLTSADELARLIDVELLRVDQIDEEVVEGCRRAEALNLAALIIRPIDADLAIRQLDGTTTVVGSVAGFPHGIATTAVTLYEVRDLVRRGARQVELFLNPGKLRSRQFQDLESEVMQAAKSCHESGAVLIVNVDPMPLGEDLKVIAAKICKRAEADFLCLRPSGRGVAPSREDVILARRALKDVCKLKTTGNPGSLEAILDFFQLGVDRMAPGDPERWVSQMRQRSEQAPSGA